MAVRLAGSGATYGFTSGLGTPTGGGLRLGFDKYRKGRGQGAGRGGWGQGSPSADRGPDRMAAEDSESS